MFFIFKFIVCSTLFLFMTSCPGKTSSESDVQRPDNPVLSHLKEVDLDFSELQKRGELRAITMYSSTSYFIYRGKPMGYEYELLTMLADHLGLKLRIIIENDLAKAEKMLKKGAGDILAHRLTITKDRKKRFAFTKYHTQTRQVLVQKKPDNWRKMKLHEIYDTLIRNPIDLIGEKVHVRKHSSYYHRLQNLSEEIGGDIVVVPTDPSTVTEELIRKVVDGSIKYTVADKNIALLNHTYHPVLDVKTELSFPQRIAWALRKKSPELKKAVDKWISTVKKQPEYHTVYNRYFKSIKSQARRAKSEFHSKKGSRISVYDDIIKKYARQIEWNWLLLASQIYQESEFNTVAVSWAGAEGLMQLMPRTAKRFGISNLSDPEQSLKAGTKYLAFLSRHFRKIENDDERKKFILAAYNAGEGHVGDARRLAKAHGADDNVWKDNVEKYLKLKEKPEYYRHPVVKYGYCRGSEPVNYVSEILERYEQYRTFIADTVSR
ncbi:MAG: transporter substrate-binding domain-containing protein [bacterium]